ADRPSGPQQRWRDRGRALHGKRPAPVRAHLRLRVRRLRGGGRQAVMQLSALQRMDALARKVVPFGLTFALMLFALTPTQVPGFSHLTPMYSLAAIYFWSIYRPDLIGYGTAFGVGLMEDLLTGAPLGSSALVLLLCQYLVFRQPKFFNAKPFGIFWAAFAVVALAAGFI